MGRNIPRVSLSGYSLKHRPGQSLGQSQRPCHTGHPTHCPRAITRFEGWGRDDPERFERADADLLPAGNVKPHTRKMMSVRTAWRKIQTDCLRAISMPIETAEVLTTW